MRYFSLIILFVASGSRSQKLQKIDSLNVIFQNKLLEAVQYRITDSYDRAVSLLEECKKIRPVAVVFNELGKNYALQERWQLSRVSFEEALEKDPENMEFVYDFCYYSKPHTDEVLNTVQDLVKKSSKFKKHLTLLYFYTGRYVDAMSSLKKYGYMFPKKQKDSLMLWCRIRSHKKEKTPETTVISNVVEIQKTENPIREMRFAVKGFISNRQTKKLMEYVDEKLESYPTLPVLYYGYGWALQRYGKFKESVVQFLEALDYLIDDSDLENKIYKALSESYRSLGDTKKAKYYADKI